MEKLPDSSLWLLTWQDLHAVLNREDMARPASRIWVSELARLLDERRHSDRSSDSPTRCQRGRRPRVPSRDGRVNGGKQNRPTSLAESKELIWNCFIEQDSPEA